MMSRRNLFERSPLENICTYLLTGNEEEIIRYEPAVRQQAELLEKQVYYFMEKLRKDVLSFNWDSVTDAETSGHLYALAYDLDNTYYDLQVLYFKAGFASGQNLSRQLNSLSSLDT